ncbi:MAG: hypothetical protein QM778_35260 [Myxococcales bacterium]
MVSAAEYGRASPRDADRWLDRKRVHSWFRVTELEALGGRIRGERLRLTVGAVLLEYGLHLREVIADSAFR